MDNSEGVFNVYIKIAKKLAFRLSDEKDRVKAIKWLKKIVDTNEGTVKTRSRFLHLLLICLQRKKLVGPFEDAPEKEKRLLSHNWKYQPEDIARNIVEKNFQDIGKPPIFTEISGNLCDYVAFQEIPQFGSHFFYAYSPEQIYKWNNLNPYVIPKTYLNYEMVPSPELSVLAKSIVEDATGKTKGKPLDDEKVYDKNGKEFLDVTVISDSGKIKRTFIDEEGEAAREIIQDNFLEEVVTTGILNKEFIQPDKEFLSEGYQIKSPVVENVQISKDHEKVIQETKIKNVPVIKKKQLHKIVADIQRNQLENEYEKSEVLMVDAKESIFARMPARLKERLSRKFVPKDLRKYPGRDPKIARTPEIFRKGVKRPFRKYKPEEFGLTKDEIWREARQVFEGLEYQPPKKSTRRSPVRREPSQLYVVRDEPVRDTDSVELKSTIKSPGILDVEKSWERSYKNMLERHRDIETPTRRRSSTRKKDILSRLYRLKSSQPKRLVFDDIDIEIEPEEVQFERFVYQEFPEKEGDVTILGDEEMKIDDIFGEEQIAGLEVLPRPQDLLELENAQILLETEMQTDDIFGDDEICDPKMVFKDISIEHKQETSYTGDVSGKQGKVKFGKRILEIPGENPIAQVYIQEEGDTEGLFDDSLKLVEPQTPPITQDIFDKLLDKKISQFQKEKTQKVRKYGSWAENFRRDVERMEKIDRNEPVSPEFPPQDGLILPRFEDSILTDTEMKTDDMFGAGRVADPSPLQRSPYYTPESKKRYDEIVKRYRERLNRPKPQFELESPEQDFLEPYIYEDLAEPQSHLLDQSFSQSQLLPPLIEPYVKEKKNLLESFEEMMDESLKLLYADSMEDDKEPLPMQDQDFLERTIYEIPGEESILLEDEMVYDDIFGKSQIEEPAFGREHISPQVRVIPAAQPPLKSSHLFHIGKRYKPTIEVDMPVHRLDEESFPDDEFLKFDFILSSAEDFVNDIEAPELAPAIGANVLLQDKNEIEAQNATDEGADTAVSFLNINEMPTDDIFGEEQILSPRHMSVPSPDRLAVMQSIMQTINFMEFKNKYRHLRGLPPIRTYNIPTEALRRKLEVESNLLDPIVDRSFRSPYPGIIDEPILEEKLQSPLIKYVKPEHPLNQYEREMMESLTKRPSYQFDSDRSILADSEMEDMFTENMIAEPILMKDIPESHMVPKSSPPKLKFSHLYLMDKPYRPTMESYLPVERIDEVSIPNLSDIKSESRSYDSLLSLMSLDLEIPELSRDDYNFTSTGEIDWEEEEFLNELFDGNIPPEARKRINTPSTIASEDLITTDQLEDIFARIAALRGDYVMGGDKVPPMEEQEMKYDDVFGEDEVLSPRHIEDTPTKLVLARSIKATEELHALRNRWRRLRGFSPLPELKPSEAIQKLKSAQQDLLDPIAYRTIQSDRYGLLDESIVEDNLQSPLIKSRTRIVYDPFADFELKMDEKYERQKVTGKDKSILSDSEMLDMFGEDMIAEPEEEWKQPLALPKRVTPPRPKPLSFSHLYFVDKPYRSKATDILPVERIDEVSFPDGGSIVDSSFIPSGFEEKLDDQTLSELWRTTLLNLEGESGPSIYPQFGNKSDEESYFTADEMITDDVFGPHVVTPPKWGRESPSKILIEQSFHQTNLLYNLRNRYRQLRGLSPIEREGDQLSKILEERNRQLMAALPATPLSPEHVQIQPDYFDSFEKRMDESFNRQIYGDLSADLTILSEMDMEDMFAADQIAEPSPFRKFDVPAERPADSTPVRPKPVTYSHLYLVQPPYKPDLQNLLTVERLDEQSFPEIDEPEFLNFVPDPLIEAEEPPEFSPDYESLTVDSQRVEDTSWHDKDPADRTPTTTALERSVAVSKKYFDFVNRYRLLKDLPAISKQIPITKMQELADRKTYLLDPIIERSLKELPKALLDESISKSITDRPLIPLPEREDYFKDFEEQLDRSLNFFAHLSPEVTYERPVMPYFDDDFLERRIYEEIPGEDSILDESEMIDMFGSDQIAEPSPLKKVPLKSPSPKQPQPVTYSHLYLTREPYRPHIESMLPVERLDEESFPKYEELQYSVYDDDEIDKIDTRIEQIPVEGQPKILSHQSSQLEEERRLNSIISEELPPSFIDYDEQHSYPFDLLDPIEFVEFPQKRSILDYSIPDRRLLTPLIESPMPRDYLQFDDSIGPVPEFPSPNLIKFREVLPGVYEPDQSLDKQRFAKQQKQILANQFGFDIEDIPDERLDTMSPPFIIESPVSIDKTAKINQKSAATSVRDSLFFRQAPHRLFTPTRSSVQSKHLEDKFKDIVAGIPQRRLSIHMSPRERIKKLISLIPKYETVALPRKTGLSPAQFVTRPIPFQEDLLEEEQFPEGIIPQEELYNISLGPLSRALYIPTAEEEIEFERSRAARKLPSPFQIPTPPPRAPFLPDASPIGRTDILPHEEDFKWLDNYMPFEEQVRGQAPRVIMKPRKAPRVAGLQHRRALGRIKDAEDVRAIATSSLEERKKYKRRASPHQERKININEPDFKISKGGGSRRHPKESSKHTKAIKLARVQGEPTQAARQLMPPKLETQKPISAIFKTRQPIEQKYSKPLNRLTQSKITLDRRQQAKTAPRIKLWSEKNFMRKSEANLQTTATTSEQVIEVIEPDKAVKTASESSVRPHQRISSQRSITRQNLQRPLLNQQFGHAERTQSPQRTHRIESASSITHRASKLPKPKEPTTQPADRRTVTKSLRLSTAGQNKLSNKMSVFQTQHDASNQKGAIRKKNAMEAIEPNKMTRKISTFTVKKKK